MKTNFQPVVARIAVARAVAGARCFLLHYLRRLIKTSGVYEQVQTLWNRHINRPACQIHGRWDEMDVKAGFCGNCLDDYLEDRPHGENKDWRPECTRS